ncbi:unnamed protein product (macronuclear) [Paramecium tetraurelia]|uniref:Protein kinase domain-containing protein n=1 Tax=Paramecium tetraurelia TaxID=5888 RepID=A0DGV2_PARTE|nr:uncharacterized protein GSPATT00002398001 [Paramecium tetraurelia]CAK82269.1 unnamed protein product [Paramecium tetraurelia]|eukprot:XP_001449666.1 hypothetical protein (macronuclear) [Paramecium tetraurelia strain d4-2]
MKISNSDIFTCYLSFCNEGQVIQSKFSIYDTYLTIQISDIDELKVDYCSQDAIFEWKLENGNYCEVIVITENYSQTYKGSKQIILNLKQHLNGKVFFRNFKSHYNKIQTIKKTKQGDISKCYNKYLNIEVIAKRFNLTQNIERQQKKLILNELKICQYLSQYAQESIIQLREFYQEKDKIILIFDFCEGGTLNSYMAQNNFCPQFIHIRKIMKKLLLAIKFLHKHNIMHRDIKMDNLMLLENNNPNSIQVIDFGFSTFIDDQPYIIERCGTPGYIAPELYSENPFDEQVDIYSLAQIFFILLTGRKFAFDSHSFKTFTLLHEKQSNIIREATKNEIIVDLFQKMTNSPEKRYNASQCLNHQYFEKTSKIKQQQKICKHQVNLSKVSFVKDSILISQIERVIIIIKP